MRFCSMYSQLLQLVPQTLFELMVRRTGVEKGQKGFSSWDQCVAMLFCQMGRAHSLREICGGLASCAGKLSHLGMTKAPSRTTLAYANQTRSYVLYEQLFYALLERIRCEHQGRHKFRFKNKLISLDATVIDLCLEMYDWAHFRRTKGAVKLHLQLDHDGYLPSFALVTVGKAHEINVARALRFEPGTIVVFDRAYTDYDWFDSLTDQGVSFVTRLKTNAAYDVVDQYDIPRRKHLLRDQDIVFEHRRAAGEARTYRLVTVTGENGEVLEFLTNNLKISPATVAAVYKERWQIELFFKALKQNLKIKTFLGTTANAVQTQIWTALIAMLLLRHLQLKARYNWSLSNLLALLRMNLFAHRNLWAWLEEPFSPPPDVVVDQQGVLQFA